MPPIRFIGFYDGYTRILGERPGAYDKAADVRGHPKRTVVDALSGKTDSETEITDPVGWAITGQMRRDKPGQSLFVDLNQDGSGVDVIDAMGKKMPASLAVPFHLYDPRTLVVEEGPAPNHLTFGIAVDPLNPDAIQAQEGGDADARPLRGRYVGPRPHAGGAQALQELRPRGGDEFQVFELR